MAVEVFLLPRMETYFSLFFVWELQEVLGFHILCRPHCAFNLMAGMHMWIFSETLLWLLLLLLPLLLASGAA